MSTSVNEKKRETHFWILFFVIEFTTQNVIRYLFFCYNFWWYLIVFPSAFLTFFCIFLLCSWQRGLILIDLSDDSARRKLASFSIYRPSTIRYRGIARNNRMIDYMGLYSSNADACDTFNFKIILLKTVR